jgi:hypothetical protein
MAYVAWTAESILQTLAAHRETLYRLGARKLGLFGSYARGEQMPDSDMDFVVTLARPSFDDFMDIQLFLENLFRCKIDLGLESSLKPEIRLDVMKDILYVTELPQIEDSFVLHPTNECVS